MKTKISQNEFFDDCEKLSAMLKQRRCHSIWGVPKNGTIIAQTLTFIGNFCINVNAEPKEFDWIIDDLIDSGKTLEKYKGFDAAVLYRKPHSPKTDIFVREIDGWIELPWEKEEKEERGNLILRLIQTFGEDSTREGLLKTPERSAKAWDKILEGYTKEPNEVMTVFENESKVDQIVGISDIEFYSTCEHHLVPFFGKASIYYIPDKKIVGASKLARILDVYARRLQNQERITKQVADFLEESLKPKAVAVILEGKHLCMMARGVEKQHSVMKTSDLRGIFRDDDAARAELFQLIK